MTIAQALKKKNVLVGEIKELKTILSDCNTRIKMEGNWEYNMNEEVDKLGIKTTELAKLKASIQKANAPMSEKIYMLSELKSTVTTLKHAKQNTKVGKKQDQYSAVVVEYESQYSKLALGEEIKTRETEIEELQQELDNFNITTNI